MIDMYVIISLKSTGMKYELKLKSDELLMDFSDRVIETISYFWSIFPSIKEPYCSVTLELNSNYLLYTEDFELTFFF